MDIAKPKDVLNRIEQQRVEESQGKRGKGDAATRSDFINYYDKNLKKVQKFFANYSPIEKTAKMWEEFNA